MTTSKAVKDSAIANAVSSINIESHFPNKVLTGYWENYFFFEPYMIFDSCFIDVKNLLLHEEKASVMALINLDQKTNTNLPAIFLEQDTGPMEYIAKLKGDGTAMNWMFLMDRYICASEIGSWAIYCEKENDIAVLAFRKGVTESACSRVAQLLNAKSIRLALLPQNNQMFDFDKLVPDWKSALVASYTLPSCN